MNFNFFLILSIYTIWDGLSLKTISRYCPFNKLFKGATERGESGLSAAGGPGGVNRTWDS